MKSNFKEVLKKEANKIQIDLTDFMLDQFEKYKDLLLEWNEKMNLTSITEDYQIIMKHFIDCLEIVKYIKNDTKVIDVGTGAGFPGIVIAIYFKGKVQMTLIDSLRKRITFLEEVIDQLQLKNVEVIHGRAEELAHKIEYREQYDIVVSRAVASLDKLLEYDIPYLRVGGTALLLKSNQLDEELRNAKKALDVLYSRVKEINDYSYQIEEELFTRKVITIEKIRETPIKYPRNYGKIKKEPL